MDRVRYILWTRAGYYALAADGTILYDGTRSYRSTSGQWRIIGIATRHMSNRLISLDGAAKGAKIGQGWIHDLDHGTHRMWGMPKTSRATSVVYASSAYQIPA